MESAGRSAVAGRAAEGKCRDAGGLADRDGEDNGAAAGRQLRQQPLREGWVLIGGVGGVRTWGSCSPCPKKMRDLAMKNLIP